MEINLEEFDRQCIANQNINKTPFFWKNRVKNKKIILDFIEELKERAREQRFVEEEFPNLYRIVMYGENVTEEEAKQYDEYVRIRERNSCRHGVSFNDIESCNSCGYDYY